MLKLGDVTGDVIDGRCVLNGEPVTLAFDACTIHEDTSICGQASECETDVIVNLEDLADGPRILQLWDCFLLHGEDDHSLSTDPDLLPHHLNASVGGGFKKKLFFFQTQQQQQNQTHSRCSFADCFDCIFYLEQMSIRAEHGDRSVVFRHLSFCFVFAFFSLSPPPLFFPLSGRC